jgi:hypothetical protein
MKRKEKKEVLIMIWRKTKESFDKFKQKKFDNKRNNEFNF